MYNQNLTTRLWQETHLPPPEEQYRDEDSLQVILTFNDGQRMRTRVWLNTPSGHRRTVPYSQAEKEQLLKQQLNNNWGLKAKGRSVVSVHLMRN